MPTLENLTNADLRALLDIRTLNKARGMTHRVLNPVRSGQTLKAQVSDTRLFEVEIEGRSDGIVTYCTCPYHSGGCCEHIAAVLVKWVYVSSAFQVTHALESSKAPASGSLAQSRKTGSSNDFEAIAPPRTQCPQELPFWLTTSLEERQQAEKRELSQWLEQTRLKDLRQFARKQGWRVKGNRKTDVVRQIVEHLTEPARILRTAQSLDDEHQQVLRAMVLLGVDSATAEEDLERVAIYWGDLGSHKRIETYTRHLCHVGLAIEGDVLGSYFHQSDLVPRAIARHLPPVLHPNQTPATERGESVESQTDYQLCLGDPHSLVRAASQITLLLQKSSPPLRTPMPRPRQEKRNPGLRQWDYDPRELVAAQQSGNLHPYSNLTLTIPPPRYSLPDETIQQLGPVAGDPARLEFIFSLLVAAGVFQPGSPVTTWPEVKESFLQQDEFAQRATLARTYFYMLNWSALWELLRGQSTDVPDRQLKLKRVLSHHYFTPSHLRSELVICRHLVLRTLASLPDNQWVALEELFSLMRKVWPQFHQTGYQPYRSLQRTGSWTLTVGRDGRALQPQNDAHWLMAQGNFIRTIIIGPLHWLGLADLSLENGNLVAFRVQNLADIFWDRSASPRDLHHAATRVQSAPAADGISTDSLSITVHPSSVSAQVHSLFDRIARLETATPERFVYQVDAQAAYEAFEDGATLSDIIGDWSALLGIPAPDEIKEKLTLWWESYGRVRIYQDVTVIEFNDEYTLAEMKAVTSLEEHLVAQISPRMVIIPQAAVELLATQLENAGYTPKRSEGP